MMEMVPTKEATATENTTTGKTITTTTTTQPTAGKAARVVGSTVFAMFIMFLVGALGSVLGGAVGSKAKPDYEEEEVVKEKTETIL